MDHTVNRKFSKAKILVAIPTTPGDLPKLGTEPHVSLQSTLWEGWAQVLHRWICSSSQLWQPKVSLHLSQLCLAAACCSLDSSALSLVLLCLWVYAAATFSCPFRWAGSLRRRGRGAFV